MADTLDPLVLDLVEWVAKEPRLYSQVIEVWRTSCPRLTESWLRKSEQRDKWSFCLTTARMAGDQERP